MTLRRVNCSEANYRSSRTDDFSPTANVTMLDSCAARPKPRWHQYGLRSLLVLMVITCAGLGWLGSRLRRIVAEESCVSAIVRMGGRVSYGVTDGPDFHTRLEDEMRHSPDRALRRMLGIDHTFVNWVELDNTRVTDGDLAMLHGLSGLEYLTLANTHISDAGLPHLYDFTHMQVVDLRHTLVTDAGVAKLQQALRECKLVTSD